MKCVVLDRSPISPLLDSLSSSYLVNLADSAGLQFCVASTQAVLSEFSCTTKAQTSIFSVANACPAMSTTLLGSSEGISCFLMPDATLSMHADVASLGVRAFECAGTFSQSTVWEMKRDFRQKMSDADRSSVILALRLRDAGHEVIVLANDGAIRRHCTEQGLVCRGTTAVLAALVCNDLLSWQKACGVYRTWFRTDPKWVPKIKGVPTRFIDELHREKIAFTAGTSFWCPVSGRPRRGTPKTVTVEV